MNIKDLWKYLDSVRLFRDSILTLRHDRYDFNDGAVIKDFTVLEFDDWVNVIALTPEEQVVMIRQFRHGINDIALEIPGGLVEDGESPKEAAARELLEETGYAFDAIRHIGSVRPNPAIQGNTCHTFLATGATLICDQKLDPTEAITVELIPFDEIPAMIKTGDINHGLVVAAFTHLMLSMD